MDYIELSLKLTPFSEEFAEILTAEIDGLGFESYMTEDPYLKAYIRKEDFSESNLKVLLSGIDQSLFNIEYTLSLIPHTNWNQVWESSFEPVVVNDQCTIKASFHKGLEPTRFIITIDPKMAFGTGHHQTTSLIVGMMLDMEEEIKGKKVLDMGCGTGVLAILAAKMKAAAPVIAIDIDPIAADSAKENTYKNRVGEKTKVLCGDASLLQAGSYDIILANINRNILLSDISTYARSLRSEGILIVSGFYQEDIPMLEFKANECGFIMEEARTKDKWSAVRFRLKKKFAY